MYFLSLKKKRFLIAFMDHQTYFSKEFQTIRKAVNEIRETIRSVQMDFHMDI